MAKSANSRDTIDDKNRPLLADVEMKAKRYMLRYFGITDCVEALIDERFGTDFRTAEPRQFKHIREATLSASYTWKSRTL